MHLMHPRRPRFARIGVVTLSFVLALSFFGCRSPSSPGAGDRALLRIQQGPNAEKNEFGLHRVDVPLGQGILFVKGPRPHLEQYDRLVLENITLKPDGGDLPWKSSTTNRLSKSFTRTLKKKIGQQQTWEMTDEHGPGVLRLRIFARELSYRPGLPYVSAARNSRALEQNKTTLVMELYDSNTGEILVQFIQRRDLPVHVQAGSETEVDRLRVSITAASQPRWAIRWPNSPRRSRT